LLFLCITEFRAVLYNCLVYDKAVEWLRRSIDTNPNSPWTYFHLGAALQLSGKAAEARAETHAGLLLDPTFTTERYRSLAFSDHQRYLTIRERTIQAMQVTGVPQESELKVREKS
jgi:tetratricopeptide (TPR) repeat protein